MDEKKHKEHVTETPDTSYIKNVDVTHEKSDVQVGSIAKFVVGLLALTVATHVVLWGMFAALERNESRREQEHPRPPMALTGEARLPPEPRLQGAPAFGESLERNQQQAEEKRETVAADPNKPKDPLWEINALRQQWNDVLEHGPVDQSGKRYGMPIEQAKEEVLKQLKEQKAEGRKQ
jgi:hypothetical protein